jgi:anti-sigma-K factor RskA
VVSLTDANGHVELGGYVLGLLDPDDRRRFEVHLAACDSCRWELAELDAAVELLRRTAPTVAPPPGLEAKVLAAVERAATASDAPAPERARPRRRLRLRPSFAGFGVLAATAAIAFLALRLDGPAGELELRATLASPAGTEAAVDVRKTGIGRVVRLRTDELPILPKGEYYELWFVGPGDTPATPNRISAGTFHPDEQGRSDVTFAAAVDPALYPVLSVTAEPGDGDPRPNGPEVLRSRP